MHKPLNGMFRVLVCRVRSRLCGLPLDAVEETLRPQPLRPLKSPAVHVQGLARIRGDWLPVVDLAGLLGLTESGAAPAPADAAAVRRYVVVRAGDAEWRWRSPRCWACRPSRRSNSAPCPRCCATATMVPSARWPSATMN
ncbi:chemotaxis protein CheW [Mitsuaria sp. TWR114]|nr:chemotaxis protein CheW [Mitsuaria sp. TWR114]